MGSGEFSTDVSLGVLTPAASVRPVGSNSHNQDPPPARRQAPDDQAKDEPASEDHSSESDASSEHQLDRLA